MIEITNSDIHKIIDDAMAKKDRTVHVYVSNGEIMSISVRPESDDGMKWITRHCNSGKFMCSVCGDITDTPSLYCGCCGERRTGFIDIEEETKND